MDIVNFIFMVLLIYLYIFVVWLLRHLSHIDQSVYRSNVQKIKSYSRQRYYFFFHKWLYRL